MISSSLNTSLGLVLDSPETTDCKRHSQCNNFGRHSEVLLLIFEVTSDNGGGQGDLDDGDGDNGSEPCMSALTSHGVR